MQKGDIERRFILEMSDADKPFQCRLCHKKFDLDGALEHRRGACDESHPTPKANKWQSFWCAVLYPKYMCPPCKKFYEDS
jgi:hypothetical protein